MNNTSEYLRYEKVSDGTAYFDIPISSSLYKRILDEINKVAPTSTDNFSMHQIGDQKKTSFLTNNFKESQTIVSPDPQVLSYIVQAEKEIREKIVSQYESEIRSLIRQDEFLDGETSQSERHMLEAYANGHIDYVTEAIKALKYLKVKKGRPVGRENFNQVNGFANLDGIILHEGGHCLHNKKMHLESTLVDLKNMTMTKADKIIAGEVSEYATTNYNEFLQEVFSGILCGDKYSQDVMTLYKKLGGVIPAGIR